MDQISAVDTKNKALAHALMAKSYLTISELQQSEIWEQMLPFFTSEITNARQLLYHYLSALHKIPVCEKRIAGWIAQLLAETYDGCKVTQF